MPKPLIHTVIPSRLGSNRVPMKGMRLLAGKTLVEHTLAAVKSSQLGEHVFINSDSPRWGELAARHGVAFYQRDPALATSDSMIDDYLHDFICNRPSDYLVVITPTSPLLTSDDIDGAWAQYQASGCKTLISAEAIQTHCFLHGQAVNFSRTGKLPRSQDLEPVVALNFTIAIYHCDTFRQNYAEHGWGVFAGDISFYLLDGFSAIDIDEEKDFRLAELAMAYQADGDARPAEYSDIVRDLIDLDVDTRT